MKINWHQKGASLEEKLADCYFQCVYYLSTYNGLTNDRIKYFKIDNSNRYHISIDIREFDLLSDIQSDDSFLISMVEEIKSIINETNLLEFNRVEEITFRLIQENW